MRKSQELLTDKAVATTSAAVQRHTLGLSAEVSQPIMAKCELTYVPAPNATGIADAGGSETTTIDAERTEEDDYWNGYSIKFTTGLNTGVSKKVTNFVAETDTLTHEAFENAVAEDDEYELIPTVTVALQGLAQNGTWIEVAKSTWTTDSPKYLHSAGSPRYRRYRLVSTLHAGVTITHGSIGIGTVEN